MPCLTAIRRNGAWCEMSTPPGLGDDAVWGSFSTGVSPARHGRFFYQVVELGSYETPYKDGSWLKREPFWSAMARSGRRVAVIDVPKCGLAREPNALQVADWRCHGRSGLPAANPPELAADLIARFGDDATDVYGGSDRRCFARALAASDFEAFAVELERSVDRKCEASEWLLQRGGWDLFLTVFKESHCVGHLCWKAPGDDEPIRRVYRKLDAAIGRLVAQVDAETRIVVFSDLGMDVSHSGEHLLDAVLERLEPRVTSRRAAVRRVLERLRKTPGDRGARARARRVIYRIEHNERSGAVRVNVVGREPRGLVRPGRERDAVCDRLTEELLALVDPDDRRPIVDSVIRCDRVYAGEHLDELPDLLVVWRRDAPIRGAASASVGEIRALEPSHRAGNHVEGGILFARGPGIPRAIRWPRADIVDLAPTLAACVGVRLEDVDGCAIDGFSPRLAVDADRARP